MCLVKHPLGIPLLMILNHHVNIYLSNNFVYVTFQNMETISVPSKAPMNSVFQRIMILNKFLPDSIPPKKISSKNRWLTIYLLKL